MVDPLQSRSPDSTTAESAEPVESPPENTALLENLIDLLSENLEPPGDTTGEGKPLKIPEKPLRSAAPPPLTADGGSTDPAETVRNPMGDTGAGEAEAYQPASVPEDEDAPRLSVVVENRAQLPPPAPTPPRSPQAPPARPPSLRSRAIVARSATSQSQLSNTTERLLHLQLRVLNTLLKLQGTTTAAEDPPPETSPVYPRQSWVDWAWSQFRLVIMVIAIALSGLGIHHWLTAADRQVQQRLIRALEADPELAVYRVQSRIEDGEIVLSGRVPTAILQASALTVAQQVAPDYGIRNEVMVVQLPPNDAALQQRVDQVLAIANEGATLRGRATVQDRSITLEGSVESDAIADRLVAQLKQIPGVLSVQDQLQRQPRAIAARVYFYAQSADVLPADLIHKLRPIADQLKAHPKWQLDIIGHQHPNETTSGAAPSPDTSLGLDRAIAVRAHLEDLGIDRRRLMATANPKPPPGTSATELAWTRQVVLFNLRPTEESSASP